MAVGTGRVIATSLNLRDGPNGNLADGRPILLLGTTVEIKDDPGNGWLLVRGMDSVGQVAWGYVDAQFISASQPAPDPKWAWLEPQSDGSSKDWTFADLKRDMTEAATKYGAFIKSAGALTGLEPSLICAIGSRESHWGLALSPPGPAGTGDRARRHGLLPPDNQGWGRGLMQADYAASDFAKDPTKWKDPKQNIEFGCKELASNLKRFQNKNLSSVFETFRAAIAAYNTGQGNVDKSLSIGRDVDSTTAGRDYSKDVISRAAWFKANGFDGNIAGM